MMPQQNLNEGLMRYSQTPEELSRIFQNNEMRKLTSNISEEICNEEKGGKNQWEKNTKI